mmetsp:Transcript_157851/g.294438  ORF Transcript_157851/g.294438 Transcript_157851/m.294438 type:complete len:213 (-) Transcript_157851:671-1309(-)
MPSLLRAILISAKDMVSAARTWKLPCCSWPTVWLASSKAFQAASADPNLFRMNLRRRHMACSISHCISCSESTSLKSLSLSTSQKCFSSWTSAAWAAASSSSSLAFCSDHVTDSAPLRSSRRSFGLEFSKQGDFSSFFSSFFLWIHVENTAPIFSGLPAVVSASVVPVASNSLRGVSVGVLFLVPEGSSCAVMLSLRSSRLAASSTPGSRVV